MLSFTHACIRALPYIQHVDEKLACFVSTYIPRKCYSHLVTALRYRRIKAWILWRPDIYLYDLSSWLVARGSWLWRALVTPLAEVRAAHYWLLPSLSTHPRGWSRRVDHSLQFSSTRRPGYEKYVFKVQSRWSLIIVTLLKWGMRPIAFSWFELL